MSEFDQVYDELTVRYAAGSVLGRAACRQAAKVLVADNVSASDLASVHALLSGLPKVAEPTPWDLTKLSDRQLRLLERLAGVAQGKAPPMAEHRPKSLSYWCAVSAAQIVDRVERRGCGLENLLPAERIELKSNISIMLSPLGTTIRNFWPEHFEALTPSFTPSVPEDQDDKRRDQQASVGLGEASGEKPSNVVDIRGNGCAGVSGSLLDRYPSLRWDPPVGKW
jgi:hypothetical protein